MAESVTRGYGLLENFLSKIRAKIANRKIPEKLRSGRILDIGCGKIPFFLLSTRFKERYGIDYAIENATAPRYEGITLKNMDLSLRKIPFEDDHFDAVTMLAVFEHIEPRLLVQTISEVRRVLKPGGRFILTTPCPWTDKLLRVMAKIRLVSQKEIEEHKGAYGNKAIRQTLEAAGFERDKIKLGYFEFFLNNWAYADKP